MWEVMEVECEGWGWLEEEKVKVLLGQDNVHGGRGEDKQQCEELSKEGDWKKEMDGIWD